MTAASSLVLTLSAAAACKGMGVSRATCYRARSPRVPLHTVRQPRRSPLALGTAERQHVLDVLHAPEYIDSALHTVYARLLDDGICLASVSTFYRLLRQAGGTRSRRDELVHPACSRPELLATKSCEVWSSDITRIKGPAKSAHSNLYVILDIFSRCVVGWMIAGWESAELAEALIADTCDRHQIAKGQLILHADRGASMRSRPVADLVADLGVVKSHSRPYVSDDNPFSESRFKTMKYRPDFPARFQSIGEARSFCQTFFAWYNDEHRHSGIGYMTPAAMHAGWANAIYDARAIVLQNAFARHPNRFKHRHPYPPLLPTVAGINMPNPVPGGDKKTENQTLNYSNSLSQSD